MTPEKRLPEPEGADADSIMQRPKKRARRTYPPFEMLTRSAKKFLPVTAVFLTTEVLEQILINLPMKDLLFAQRVCKKWQAVIRDNQDLQRALFFMPEEPSIFWKAKGRKQLYGSRQLCGCVERIGREEYESATDPCKVAYTARVNPLLLKHIEDGSFLELWGVQINPTVGDALYCDLRKHNHADGHASWRRMFLTQPPTRARFQFAVWPDEYDSFTHSSHRHGPTVENSHPRMGTILDMSKVPTPTHYGIDGLYVGIEGAIFNTEKERANHRDFVIGWPDEDA